jgi:hypothetical protein
MAVCCAVLGVTVAGSPAQAAFPGQNGKIAFTRYDDNEEGVSVHTVNPDGSGLSSSIGTFFYSPAWSPDGLSFAYDDRYIIYTGLGWTPEEDLAVDAAWSPDGTKIVYETYDGVTIANADGSGRTPLGVGGSGAAWSPDGTRIAFGAAGDVYVIDADGTNLVQLTSAPGSDGAPNWSPAGSKIAFASSRDGNSELYVMNPDGSGQARLTTTATNELSPAWSPDGTKIAFSTGNPSAIWYMNADGTGATPVTTPYPNGQDDFDPDWQPVPINGYARPKGTGPIHASLVPAYQSCSAPDRTHGPPLAFGSCAAPRSSSELLTVGTADANGRAANSTSYVRYDVIVGNPATAGDEADVHLEVGIADVRNAGSLTDYVGDLTVATPLRITDKLNTPHPGGPGAGTVSDTSLGFNVTCAATADTTVGSTCALSTTYDALVPGAVTEGRRSIWELGQVEVRDSGGAPFMRQGIFVP